MGKKRLRAVFFGPHGSGKRTQAEWLAASFSVSLISSGRLLHEEIRAGSEIGKFVKEYVEQGMLVPDDLVNAVLLPKIRRLANADKGFVLEGYPRNVEQAAALEKAAHIQIAIHLKMTDELAAERVENRRDCHFCGAVYHLTERPPGPLETCLECGSGLEGRCTDQPNAFFGRQAIYHFMTEPLISYYRQRGTLLTIKADQKIEPLADEIRKKLQRLGFVLPLVRPVRI